MSDDNKTEVTGREALYASLPSREQAIASLEAEAVGGDARKAEAARFLLALVADVKTFANTDTLSELAKDAAKV